MKNLFSLLLISLLVSCNSENKTLTITFLHTNGLVKGNPVLINGFQVGEVTKIALDSSYKIEAEIYLNDTVRLPKDSKFNIGTKDLFTKAILVTPGKSNEYLTKKDKIKGQDEQELQLDSNLDKLFSKSKDKSITLKNSIQNIQKIFENYIKQEESTDSPDNKDLMTISLKSLTKVSNSDDLELLINVWMYYDPTDFPSRELVLSVLNKNKLESIEAIKRRMRHKKKWETENVAPFSELKDLLSILNKL